MKLISLLFVIHSNSAVTFKYSNSAFIFTSGEGDLRSCVASLDTCRLTYKIDSLKFGTEDDLLIYVDMNSTNYHDIRDGEAI